MALAMRRGPDDGSVGYDRVAASAGRGGAGRAGRAFLTEGDPMLYGSGSYVAERLRAIAPDVPVEIVPGVSAISAAAARLGWPLAQKEEILTVCPATYHPDEIGAILDRGGSSCWLKAAGRPAPAGRGAAEAGPARPLGAGGAGRPAGRAGLPRPGGRAGRDAVVFLDGPGTLSGSGRFPGSAGLRMGRFRVILRGSRHGIGRDHA